MHPTLHRWEAAGLPHVELCRAAVNYQDSDPAFSKILDAALDALDREGASVERLRAKLSRIRALASDAINAAEWTEGEGFAEVQASITAILVEAAP